MMKKFSFFLIVIVSGLFYSVHAQTLVGTNPTLKNVVLEEYTGIHCQYCPDGHLRAQTLFNENPGRVVLLNIHQGGYAVPSGGEPDYRTAFGDLLAGQANLGAPNGGYPAATVNRHVFAALSYNTGGTAMGRGNWATAAGQIFPETSPVNVGLSSVFDSATRLLTVTVETYYTANSPQTTNYINVALCENGIIGPQQVSSTWVTNYTHNHMLRNFLTGQWGDTLTATTTGSFTQRIYTYTVPVNFNVDNCDVAAYVAESYQEIYTGQQVVAKGGTTLMIGDLTDPNPAVEIGLIADTTIFFFTTSSSLPGTEDFKFELASDMPSDWDAFFTVDEIIYNDSTVVALTNGTPFDVMIKVVPGTTPYIGTFTLTMSSVSNPLAPVKIQKVRVISNVTDLVINNDAPWGDGGSVYSAKYFESNYLNGLIAAGNTNFTSSPLKTFMEVSKAGKLTGVDHLYFNIGWSFPSFTDENVVELTDFLDNGGNLFVSGQDIGWDTWDLVNGGNGTTTTQSFYTNYLNASFVSDGTTANNIMTPLQSDAIFTGLDTSAIVNVYGSTYFYPDQIDTIGIGFPVFYYNSSLAKMGGCRATNGTWKVVYFASSLEMIADSNIRKDVIHIAHDWFHGYIIGAQDYDNAMSKLFLGQNYPNPANSYTTIELTGFESNSVIEVFDIFGSRVFAKNLTSTDTKLMINTQGWKQGTYFYRIIATNTVSDVKKIVIAH